MHPKSKRNNGEKNSKGDGVSTNKEYQYRERTKQQEPNRNSRTDNCKNWNEYFTRGFPKQIWSCERNNQWTYRSTEII